MRERTQYLIIGSKGMLGTDLVRSFTDSGKSFCGVDVDEIDITNSSALEETILALSPKTIINCAAYTDVDGCEANVDLAFQVNEVGPANIARIATKTGAHLIHIGTDYVFDGTAETPYVEDDAVNPLGVYGKSKAGGDAAIRAFLPDNHTIVRTQWLYGVHGKNFVETILNLARSNPTIKVVNDQIGSPTYSVDLAAAISLILDLNYRGTIHVTNSGIASWYDFALEIVRKSGIQGCKVEPTTTREFNRPAPRPLYSVLDNSRFIGLTGTPLRSWHEALDAYLEERKSKNPQI